MKPGDEIRVSLPGETMWAEVKEMNRDGIVAILRNGSIHEEFNFGDEVVLGPDDYTVVEPKAKLESVERALAEWRRKQRLLA